MAFSISKVHFDSPRGSTQAAVAGLLNALAAYDLNQALTAAGCATATTTSQVKTVNTLTFLINGAFKSKAATDNFWTLAGTLVAASSFQKYALLIDASGAATIQEATQNNVSAATVSWANVSRVSDAAPLLTITAGGTKAVAGVLTVATDATHTFTPGTTLLGAAGITATYIDGLDPSLLPLIGDQVGNAAGLT